ncbi:hypothetical protein BUE76_09520 [Cnuella takakiae]|nr:hypothetical protein BUE76_09520 [Cnuella takakiae]
MQGAGYFFTQTMPITIALLWLPFVFLVVALGSVAFVCGNRRSLCPHKASKHANVSLCIASGQKMVLLTPYF